MSEVMSCPHCAGDMSITPELRGRTVRCPHCQKELSIPLSSSAPTAWSAGPGEASGHVANYLVQAILVTIFCCLPLGVVAIVYAAQVDGKLAARDYVGARSDSETARKWCWAAFLCSAIPVAIWLVLVGIGLLAGAIQ